MAIINGNARPNYLSGTNSADRISGFGNDDTLLGRDGNDKLNGGPGDDYLSGGAGRDTLIGGNGDDFLYGGSSADFLTGGHGSDVFYYASTSDSRFSSGVDVIKDFRSSQGDKLDVHLIDGPNASFIGSNSFHGTAGEVNYRISGGNTFVSGDTNGDRQADFTIELRGVHRLHGSDFDL